MSRNFDDYPGFQPFRSWANTYAQDCRTVQKFYGRNRKYFIARFGGQKLDKALQKKFWHAH